MIDVRAEREADHAAVDDVVRRAFAREAVVELVNLIRQSPNYVPELSLVAEGDGKVVGHVMLSHVKLDDNGTSHQVVTLSPLAVAPEAQRQGVGGALVKAAIEKADRLGEPLIVLEGSPEYYPRYGFEPSRPLGITIDLPDWAHEDAAQVYRLSNYQPEIRGHVVYPPAFDVVSHD